MSDQMFKNVDLALAGTKMTINNSSYILSVYDTKVVSRYNLMAALRGLNATTDVASTQLQRMDLELMSLRVESRRNKFDLDNVSRAYLTASSEWDRHDEDEMTAADSFIMTPGRNMGPEAAQLAADRRALEQRNLARQLAAERDITGDMVHPTPAKEELDRHRVTVQSLRHLHHEQIRLLEIEARIEHRLKASEREQTEYRHRQAKIALGQTEEINLFLNRVWDEGPQGMISPPLLARIKAAPIWEGLREYQLQSMGRETWTFLKTIKSHQGPLELAAMEAEFMSYAPKPKMTLPAFDIEFARLRLEVPDIPEEKVALRYLLVLREYFSDDKVMGAFLEPFYKEPQDPLYIPLPRDVAGVKVRLLAALRSEALSRPGVNFGTLTLTASHGSSSKVVVSAAMSTSKSESAPSSVGDPKPIGMIDPCYVCGGPHKQHNCRYIPADERRAWASAVGKTKAALESGEIPRSGPKVPQGKSKNQRGKTPPVGAVKRPAVKVVSAITTDALDEDPDSDFDFVDGYISSSFVLRNNVVGSYDNPQQVAIVRRLGLSESQGSFISAAIARNRSTNFADPEWVQLDHGSEISLCPMHTLVRLVDEGPLTHSRSYRVAGSSMAHNSVVGPYGHSPVGPIFLNESPGGRSIISQFAAEIAGCLADSSCESLDFPTVTTSVALFVPCRDFDDGWGHSLRFFVPVLPRFGVEQPPGTSILVAHIDEVERWMSNIRADYGQQGERRHNRSDGNLQLRNPVIVAALDTGVFEDNRGDEIDRTATFSTWHDDGPFFHAGPYSRAELEQELAAEEAVVVATAHTRLMSRLESERRSSEVVIPPPWSVPYLPDGSEWIPVRPPSPHPAARDTRTDSITPFSEESS